MTMNRLSKVCLTRSIHVKVLSQKSYSTALSSDYVDVPQYPPIEDPSRGAKIKRKEKQWHTKIQTLPTVEQKLIELNMPKYYGYKSVCLTDVFPKINSLDYLKYVTRTHVVKDFPQHYYNNLNSNVEVAVSRVKSKIEDLILLHFRGENLFRDRAKLKLFRYQRTVSQNFIADLNSLLMNALVDDIPHLSPTAIDLRPRIEGFWFVGGFEPRSIIKKTRERCYVNKHRVNEPVDQSMRSSVHPCMVLRIKDGLPEVVPMNDVLSTTGEIPVANFHHSSVGYGFSFRNAVIVPGFWPGESHEHGHLFLYSREAMMQLDFKDNQDFLSVALEQKAILSGFTQAHSYAFYQGFTPVNEMTYPITQQLATTDGKNWQFGVYQMNTCVLHSDMAINNPRNNILWLSEDMPLYEAIEGDSVKGFNEEVVKKICLMYLKKGEPRADVNPYVGDNKYLMDHDAPDEYKHEFQKQLHYRLSERPKHIMKPEVLPWEWIYKIKFQTRPMDAKRKFFEYKWAQNPNTRRMDEYQLPHIAKVKRVNVKISRYPRINSEHLFKHDFQTIQYLNLYPDDEAAFKTMNVKKGSAPYYTGLKWSRGMNSTETKI